MFCPADNVKIKVFFMSQRLEEKKYEKKFKERSVKLSMNNKVFNPFKTNGFFHSYYLEKCILHFRGVRLMFSSLA